MTTQLETMLTEKGLDFVRQVVAKQTEKLKLFTSADGAEFLLLCVPKGGAAGAAFERGIAEPGLTVAKAAQLVGQYCTTLAKSKDLRARLEDVDKLIAAQRVQLEQVQEESRKLERSFVSLRSQLAHQVNVHDELRHRLAAAKVKDEANLLILNDDGTMSPSGVN